MTGDLIFVVAGIGLTIVLAFLFSSTFVKRYMDERDGSCSITTACIVTMTVAMFCVFIIPVDVYSVTFGVMDDGLQGNPGLVSTF